MQDERPCVEIPENRNVVAHEVILGGFARAPVGRDRRKFPYNERLNVRYGRLLIICIRSDVSNVRVGQADNLAGVAGIGEDFLISCEARIENDFAAAPGYCPSSTAVKNAPIFERKNSLSCFRFRQWTPFFPLRSLCPL